jgi:hypothetical protein
VRYVIKQGDGKLNLSKFKKRAPSIPLAIKKNCEKKRMTTFKKYKRVKGLMADPSCSPEFHLEKGGEF